MANEQNLRPIKLTHEEAMKNGKKGGIASAKAKRETKAVKYYIDTFLKLPLENEQAKEKLKALGIDTEDIDNKMAMIYAQWGEAMKGNTKAFENLLNYSGEKPIEQIQNINPPVIKIERPKE